MGGVRTSILVAHGNAFAFATIGYSAGLAIAGQLRECRGWGQRTLLYVRIVGGDSGASRKGRQVHPGPSVSFESDVHVLDACRGLCGRLLGISNEYEPAAQKCKCHSGEAKMAEPLP